MLNIFFVWKSCNISKFGSFFYYLLNKFLHQPEIRYFGLKFYHNPKFQLYPQSYVVTKNRVIFVGRFFGNFIFSENLDFFSKKIRKIKFNTIHSGGSETILHAKGSKILQNLLFLTFSPQLWPQFWNLTLAKTCQIS